MTLLHFNLPATQPPSAALEDSVKQARYRARNKLKGCGRVGWSAAVGEGSRSSTATARPYRFPVADDLAVRETMEAAGYGGTAGYPAEEQERMKAALELLFEPESELEASLNMSISLPGQNTKKLILKRDPASRQRM